MSASAPSSLHDFTVKNIDGEQVRYVKIDKEHTKIGCFKSQVKSFLRRWTLACTIHKRQNKNTKYKFKNTKYNRTDCFEDYLKMVLTGGPWRVQGKGLRGGECGKQVSVFFAHI